MLYIFLRQARQRQEYKKIGGVEIRVPGRIAADPGAEARIALDQRRYLRIERSLALQGEGMAGGKAILPGRPPPGVCPFVYPGGTCAPPGPTDPRPAPPGSAGAAPPRFHRDWQPGAFRSAMHPTPPGVRRS